MKKRRRKYTREFKVEAVGLLTEQRYSLREAAESLGVSVNSLRTWRKAFEEEGNKAFPGNGNLSPADEEVRRLLEENRRLRMERDILKKATAFFANDPS